MAHSTQYLYELEPYQLAEMSYKSALELKVDAATSLLRTLVEPSHKDWEHERVAAVHKAIEFNKDLLKELEC